MGTMPWDRYAVQQKSSDSQLPWEKYAQGGDQKESISDNPKGEGTYAMWDTAGHKLDIPYSKVQGAQRQGFKFDANKDQSGMTPQTRFTKDLAAAQDSSALAPKGGWSSPGDLVRATVSGVKNMVAHPLQSIATAGEPFVASGTAPGGMYPTHIDVNPQVAAQNREVQQQAQQGQAQQAQFAKENPLYAIGSVLGPGLVTSGIARGLPAAAGATMEGLGRAALLGRTPEAAYESALKPSTALPVAKRAAIINTALEQGIPVSKAGLEKIGDLVEDLNQKIKAEIDSKGNQQVISPSSAAKNIQQVHQKFANQVNPTADLNAIESSKQEFLDQFRQNPGNPQSPIRKMSGPEAQAMKQGTYRVLSGKYGEQGSASVEAQKALARGLKEEIANAFPEIKDLNTQESRLLDLQPVLERAVNRISNHQAVGIGTPITGGAVAATTGSSTVGAIAGFMKAVLDNPSVKSRLAIMVSKSQKIPIAQASKKVQAYAAALGSAVGSSAAIRESSGQQPEAASGDTSSLNQ